MNMRGLAANSLVCLTLLAPNGVKPDGLRLPLTTTVRDALSQLLAEGSQPIAVVDDDGKVAGVVTLELLGRLLA